MSGTYKINASFLKKKIRFNFFLDMFLLGAKGESFEL